MATDDGKVTMRVDPDARNFLNGLLMKELMGTGIGYSEFIRLSVEMWRQYKVIGQPCEFEGCDRPADWIVGRDVEVTFCCDHHKDTALWACDTTVDCPNCGCKIGVTL